MPDQPDRFDPKSLDVAEARRADLLRLFPEARTEGGKIDFDRLRAVLGETIDAGRERYAMTWPGKADCFQTIQAPSLATLLPCPEESVNFATTENLIIEGDNLEVLKLLQKSYLGKVKMIYIDPPYNTGKDFIYPDNYTESLQTYLEYTGQVDDEGRKFGTNTDTDGRFHSKWLNMMYTRLYLARNLLREDGVIFVSMNDGAPPKTAGELRNLRAILDELFGEENFVACLPTIMNLNGNYDAYGFVDTHEYTVVYARNRDSCQLGVFDIDETSLEEWMTDEYGLWKRADTLRRTGQDASRERRPLGWFPVFVSSSDEIYVTADNQPRSPKDEVLWPVGDDGDELSWTWSKRKITDEPHNLILVNGRKQRNIYKKQRPQLGDLPTKKPKSVFYRPEYSSSTATTEFTRMFGYRAFDNPKPMPLIRDFIKIGDSADGIVLDFFAGSGTTAHAVLDLNKQDGGRRKFILVQLPEPTERGDYRTIAEITKERVRRVVGKLDTEDAGKLAEGAKPDRGFRVFKLAESNFTPWDADAPQDGGALNQQIGMHVEHIRAERTERDLLYEVILKAGLSLTVPVETLQLAGKTVYRLTGIDGPLLVCLERGLTLDVMRAIAKEGPRQVVMLDEGFAGNDQLKANAVQTFKTRGGVKFETI